MQRALRFWIALAVFSVPLFGTPPVVRAVEETEETPSEIERTDDQTTPDSSSQPEKTSSLDKFSMTPLTGEKPKTESDVQNMAIQALQDAAAAAGNPMSKERAEQLKQSMILDGENPLASPFMQGLIEDMNAGDEVVPQIVDGQLMGFCNNTKQLCRGNPFTSPEESQKPSDLLANNPVGNTTGGEVFGPPCPPDICPPKGDVPIPRPKPKPTQAEQQQKNEKAAGEKIAAAAAGNGDTSQVIEAMNEVFNGTQKDAADPVDGSAPNERPNSGDLAASGGSGPFGGTSMRVTPAAADAMAGRDVTADMWNASPENKTKMAEAAVAAYKGSQNFSIASLLAPTGPTVADLNSVVNEEKGTMSFLRGLFTDLTTPQPDDGAANSGNKAYEGSRGDRAVIQVGDNHCRGFNNTLRTGAQLCTPG